MKSFSLSRLQRAYLAGLIDGEGSLESQRQMHRNGRTPRFVLRISFVFGTAEPVTTVAEWLGIEVKKYPPPSPRHSPRWRAAIPKSIAVQVLRSCLPFLILKRRQAELVLAIEQVRAKHSPSRIHKGAQQFSVFPAAAVAEMQTLHDELRSLKSSKRRQTK